MDSPPRVQRSQLPNAIKQRELEAELGGNRRSRLNLPRSPERYVPTAKNLLQRYPKPEPVDPRYQTPYNWKKASKFMPWLEKIEENNKYSKLPVLTKRKRTNNNEQPEPKKLNFGSRKSKKSKKSRRTRKN